MHTNCGALAPSSVPLGALAPPLWSVLVAPPSLAVCAPPGQFFATGTTRDNIRGTSCLAPPFTPAPRRAASYLLALCLRPSGPLLPPLSVHALCEQRAKQYSSPRLSLSCSAPVVRAPVLLFPSPSPAFWSPYFCPLWRFSRTMRSIMHDNLRSTLHARGGRPGLVLVCDPLMCMTLHGTLI